MHLIWVRPERKYFCKWGWTGKLAKHELICPTGAYSGVYARQAAPRGGGARQRSSASRLRFWAVETPSHIESRLAINASPTIVPQASKLRSPANLLLVSAVGYGGLALRTLTTTYWKHLSGSLFSVLEDLNLLQGDEAAGHHLVKDGQETVDAVFAIDDFD